jgi:hypothetical protein
MSTIVEQREQFKAISIVRTLPLSEEEEQSIDRWGAKQDALGDKGVMCTEWNNFALMHWHLIGGPGAPGGYLVTEQSLDTAATALKLLLDKPATKYQQPTQWVSSDPEQVLRRGGLVSHTDISKVNEEIGRSSRTLVNETKSIVEKAQRNTAFVDLKRTIDGVLVNSRIPELIDRAGSVRARIDRWEQAKSNFPERIADIDREIAREQAKLR